MTDRLIVATFRDTNAAYDAASAIKNLKDSGLTEFKLKAGVMVQKDDRGGYRGDGRTQRRCRDGGPRFRLRRQCNRRDASGNDGHHR